MKMKMVWKNRFLVTIFLSLNLISHGQIKSGKIVFERKTNLEKEFKDEKDEDFRDFIKKNKVKIEEFELIFNDTCSIFRPVHSDVVDDLAWATTRNTTYQSNTSGLRLAIFTIWGQEIYIQDSINKREWKITDSKRVIGKYECRKAVWQKNDSTRIYAWFSSEIVPNVGPEGYSGLPGTILGLANEDGGIIYFAKSVEVYVPAQEEFQIETKRKKLYTYEQLKQKLEEDYGDEVWGKNMFERLFRWL